MIELRDYQQICTELVFGAYKENPHGQALLVLPTGSGKTIIFSYLVYLLSLKTLIIAHRDELLDQAAEKYRLIKPDAIIGKVGSGKHEYGGEVTVASIATISRPAHLKRLKEQGYGLVIVDEAHHVAANGYQRVLEALPNTFKLMVTATPDRLDGKPIIEGDPLYSCSIVDMIDQSYLCDVRAIAIRTNTNLNGIHTKMGDYSEKELDEAINTPERNMRIVEAYQEHASERIAICFCVTVDHAEKLADTFNAEGIPAGFVCGETPHDERKRLYASLREGKIRVLCNVQVLTEGFDEPLVDCVIMARPTQSRALYVQCSGRGLRIAPGKKDCLILDLTDNCMKHRLQAPQSLSKVLGIRLKDGESVGEQRAAERKRKQAEEEAEREKQERKLKIQRSQDVHVNLLQQPFKWIKRDSGEFFLDVAGSRIRLIPGDRDGYYRVVARLAGDFIIQEWSAEQPLSWAQQFAEKRAAAFQEDSNKARILFDKNAAWRRNPLDPESKQAATLRAFRIPIKVGMTKGEASDIISAKFAERERRNQQAS